MSLRVAREWWKWVDEITLTPGCDRCEELIEDVRRLQFEVSRLEDLQRMYLEEIAELKKEKKDEPLDR